MPARRPPWRSSTPRARRPPGSAIELLLDPDSFTELDEFARHRSTSFGMEKRRPYGDGVITGFGTIDGPSGVRVQPGRDGIRRQPRPGLRREDRQDHGLRAEDGVPADRLNEGGGARIQEGVVSLGLYGEIFRRNTHASGVIPQISLIMGAAAGGHVYSPALTDFVIMVDQTSQMFITGPDVIKTVTGEDVIDGGTGRRAHPQHEVWQRRTTSLPTKRTRSPMCTR